jgi:DNA primase
MQSLARAVGSVSAALAYAALSDPEMLDDHLEDISRHGFGHPSLDGLANELVRLRMSIPKADSAELRRNLSHSGFDPLLAEVDKAAAKCGASFLDPSVSGDLARCHWTYFFSLMNKVRTLDEGVAAAKATMKTAADSAAMNLMKAERDALVRTFGSESFWKIDE